MLVVDGTDLSKTPPDWSADTFYYTGLPVEEAKSILRYMGAVNIISLDGGGSTQLYADGEHKVVGDGRKIGSVIQVYAK